MTFLERSEQDWVEKEKASQDILIKKKSRPEKSRGCVVCNDDIFIRKTIEKREKMGQSPTKHQNKILNFVVC